jgi:hypothetical protein
MKTVATKPLASRCLRLCLSLIILLRPPCFFAFAARHLPGRWSDGKQLAERHSLSPGPFLRGVSRVFMFLPDRPTQLDLQDASDQNKDKLRKMMATRVRTGSLSSSRE